MAADNAESLIWEEEALRTLERETIYLRERLRDRVEGLVRESGRLRVTLADLEQARRMPGGMGRAEAPEEPFPEPPWPVTFGVFHLLDPEGGVAICTLASEGLMDELAKAHPPGVAIVGRAFTENFGVEKVAVNVVANPHLRVLVLCGTESRHRVGETLLALHANGVDKSGRVVGSTSPLPLVHTLTPEAVRIFREKLQVIDLRGENRPEVILDRARHANAEGRTPWPQRWEPSVATLRLGPGAIPMSGRFTPDPKGLFLIGIGPSERTIHLEHYTREGVLDRRVIGGSAESICRKLIEEGLLGDLGHATYVGRELQKAELALRLGVTYEQDRELELPS